MENITLSVTFNYKWFEFESSLRSILIDGSQLLLLSASTPIWLVWRHQMKTVISIAIVSIIMSIEVNYHTTFYHIYDSIYKVSVGQHMLNLSIYVLFVTNTTTT